jgi:general secretion pathway protein N
MRLALRAVPLPPLRFVLGAIALYAVFLLVMAPAWIVADIVPKFSKLPLSVESARGTLWRGEFSGANVSLPSGKILQFEQLKWRFAPLALLRGELAVHTEFKGSIGQGAGMLGRGLLGGLRLSDYKASLSANLIPVFVPALEIWKPGGVVELATTDFTYAGAESRGKAELVWRQASITLSPINPIGEYKLAVDAVRNVQYQLSSAKGPLLLEGQGAWQGNQEPTFNGTARAEQRFQGQLLDLLRLLGKEESGGVFRMRWPASQ